MKTEDLTADAQKVELWDSIQFKVLSTVIHNGTGQVSRPEIQYVRMKNCLGIK